MIFINDYDKIYCERCYIKLLKMTGDFVIRRIIMIVTILGSSAKQTNLRECVSVLLDVENETVLFDAGPGIVSSLERANRKTTEINKVILTHVHGDHMLGFAYFIWTRNGDIKAIKNCDCDKFELNVYGQNDTIQLAKMMLDMAYPGLKLLFKINFIEIQKEESIVWSNNTYVEFYDAIHAVPTISTIIKAEGKKFVYTSDTLPNENLYDVSAGASFLIHEGMFTNENFDKSRKTKHSTSLDAAQFANTINAEQLVLVHILPKMFGREGDMLKEAASVYKGVLSIPFDGCVYYV